MNGTEFIEALEVEVDCKVYFVDVNVCWWYDPGVWTFSNGDPGYPPDQGYEFDIVKIVDEDGRDLELSEFDYFYDDVDDKLSGMNFS